MKTPTLSKTFFGFAMIISLIMVGLTSSAFSQGSFHGAIYTSESDGVRVNQNLYDSKDLVYLNGGPQNQNAAGLPNGTYYFQVTNPSGSVLLSEDLAVCRQLVVVGGVIAGATGPCPHPNGTFNPSNGSTPVKLMPFLDTPNNGGEYKVWLIRQASTTTIAADGIRINFKNSNAKTDNFKVREKNLCVPGEPGCPLTITLSGTKFYDANANSINDGESSVEGVRIRVTLGDDPNQTEVIVTTDANGNWSVPNVPTGTSYVVEEILPCVDADGDEECDTDRYWVQTAPVADSQGFQGYSGTANSNVSGLDFGNICFGPASGGYTLGFWSNKNGYNTMAGFRGSIDPNVFPALAPPSLDTNTLLGSLNFLSRLNLKNSSLDRQTGNALDFDPTTYPNFRTWLLNGDSVNMAYMLSVQLAATSLNCRYQFLSDNQIVDGTSVGLGITSIGAVRMGANTSLNNNAWTISGDPHRQSQEMMKNFLDRVNNDQLPFASSSACSVFYPLEEK